MEPGTNFTIESYKRKVFKVVAVTNGDVQAEATDKDAITYHFPKEAIDHYAELGKLKILKIKKESQCLHK